MLSTRNNLPCNSHNYMEASPHNPTDTDRSAGLSRSARRSDVGTGATFPNVTLDTLYFSMTALVRFPSCILIALPCWISASRHPRLPGCASTCSIFVSKAGKPTVKDATWARGWRGETVQDVTVTRKPRPQTETARLQGHAFVGNCELRIMRRNLP